MKINKRQTNLRIDLERRKMFFNARQVTCNELILRAQSSSCSEHRKHCGRSKAAWREDRCTGVQHAVTETETDSSAATSRLITALASSRDFQMPSGAAQSNSLQLKQFFS